MRRWTIPLTAIALFPSVSAEAATAQQTYANPIDIDYRYNFEEARRGISFRTGADPVVVRHNGAFYLFATLADGYWRSRDLLDWQFVTPSRWPADSIIAPAVISDGERLIIMPSMTQPGPIYESRTPETGKLDYYLRRTAEVPGTVARGREQMMQPDELPPGPWDPALFRDDDGKWYLYYGSSNHFPIYGVQLDPAAQLGYLTKPSELFKLHPEQHGWERFGQDHSGTFADGRPIAPFIEGAWMTKVGGRYYLQYGAPGTEYNAYANGTYVGDSPMGPFHYASYNPVAYKPGGFVWGAGHGSTFQDKHGNWWNSGTAWIGHNTGFERRVTISPARFYADGQMAVSTRFGDYPHYVPDKAVVDPASLFTGWMLLSYRAKVIASSTYDGFSASFVTDENPRTFWVAKTNSPGQWIQLDLGKPMQIRAAQVNFADYKSGRYGDAADVYTEFQLEHSLDGNNWHPLVSTEGQHRDRPNAYFELTVPVKARYVRYVHSHVGARYLAISDIRLFGHSGGANPASPATVRAVRAKDRRDAEISWMPVRGAVGYNLLWGIRPDRLTLCYQIFDDEAGGRPMHRKTLRALNAAQDYYFAVEAFNRNGVSKRSIPIRAPESHQR